MESIYEEILERSKSPTNFGELKNPDLHIEDINPLCGDKIEIFAKIENSKIKEIKFKGAGCAINKASTDILLDTLKEKNIKEIKNITNEDFLDLLGIKVSPMRLKCALLGLVAIKKGISDLENDIRN